MDRQIVWPGAIPLETDILNTNKYAMIGLAKLASALLGSNTYVHGLACTASSPASMIVNVAAGQIYSLQNIDGTAYSSLAADTTHAILKQGLVLDATPFTLTAPGTSGYSINYLIQVTYTDTDSGATVLPYYNASNPSVAWSGPNNSGTAQNTVRSGVCTVALKAGVAATTGTQTTPSPDTGYTGLYVITVSQGATTVTSANISVYPNAPILNQAGIYDSFQRNTAIYGADTGSANAYVVNINPKILSLSDGAEVIFKATNANTTSSTLNVCALGAFPVISKSGATLIANEIVANSLVKVRWVASSSSWALLDATGTFHTAPTATAGTSTAQVATTAFVANAILGATGRLIGAPKIFTGNGTYTPTAGTSFIIVEAIGGGGGGGGSYTTSSGQRACAGGGGAGGYGRALFTSGFSSIAVTIGNGGAGGAANTAAAGGTGGVTSFGSLLVCSGGTGGTFSSNWALPIHTSGAPSGTATSGANLGTHSAPAGAAGYYANNGWLSGAGASSPLGRGGVQIGGTSVGQAATGFGSGGGGAATGESATGQSGGAGSNGVVIVWEYA